MEASNWQLADKDTRQFGCAGGGDRVFVVFESFVDMLFFGSCVDMRWFLERFSHDIVAIVKDGLIMVMTH